MFFKSFNIAIIVFPFIFITAATMESELIIKPNNSISNGSNEIFGDFVQLQGLSSLEVHLTNVDEDVSFIIFQVHSHLHKITLSINDIASPSKIYGTNLGFYSDMENGDIFYISNSKTFNVTVYISVHGYKDTDPIPGGFDIDSSIAISPFTLVEEKIDYLWVKASGARDADDPRSEHPEDVSVDFYMMYMPENNLDTSVYFDSIRRMMTLNEITANGKIIPPLYYGYMFRWVAAYPCTGVVFVAVATSLNTGAYSVYVPGQTYAKTISEDNVCRLLDDMLSQLMCAPLIFVGIFLCYLGHRYFKIELFLSGFMSGIIVTYLIISSVKLQDTSVLLMASITVGLFGGAIWMFLWWYYANAFVSVLLPSLNLGFLLSCITYHGFPNEDFLKDDLVFWLQFVLATFLVAVVLSPEPFVANLLFCAVLGSYAIIFSIDSYIGSSLKYIIINVVRRASVARFGHVWLMPPFLWQDISLTVLWAVLAVSSFVCQYYLNLGRPSFPTTSRRATMHRVYGAISEYRNRVLSATRNPGTYNETTPLLQ